MVTAIDNTNSNGIFQMENKLPLCPKCNSQFDYRVHRSFFVKTFLFWLPLRRYACYSCKRKYYILHGKPFTNLSQLKG
jgi:transposase-like protein